MDGNGPVLTLMCALVVRGAFDQAILPAFEAATGCRFAIDWSPTAVVMERIAAGARPDLVLVTDEAAARLAAQGLVDPADRRDVVVSRIGLAVRAGAPHPDIATPEACIRALLAARSVAYSRTGASGIHFAAVIRQLGIAEAIDARATVIPAGFTAERLASGEADLAVQQVSELRAVPGVEIVGPLPPPLGKAATFAAAIMRAAADRALAGRFLAALQGPEAEAAYRASGLDPVGGRAAG
ncbi:substrate-binding domain-containing protein [Roseomonas sp. NAR14]|uniref:Substrate-binding domain-containing protein n=1 Tax=Roseomonas acroporae TaxID=2937791 RepID=A0A9X1YB73_9PROT|nr:substrate-binding domain-containing protein [Roseomonas acroporae]MCK8786233.1 substrate-binding domain-containing protein [Roseomonas acroporae]